jgi:hypothetical protein
MSPNGCARSRSGSPASVLLMELRERSYAGGYTMLKMFAAPLRPKELAAPSICPNRIGGQHVQQDARIDKDHRSSPRVIAMISSVLGPGPKNPRHLAMRSAGRPTERSRSHTADVISGNQNLRDGYSSTRRRRSALAITDTELNAIAAAAITGDSRMPKNG